MEQTRARNEHKTETNSEQTVTRQKIIQALRKNGKEVVFKTGKQTKQTQL
jgi:hypothetical protein